MEANAAVDELGLRRVAEMMCLAARTAPKARGLDNVFTAIIEGAEKSAVTAKMRAIGEAEDLAFFVRDAENCDGAPLVVVVGTKLGPVGVPHCGYCGCKDCEENAKASNVCIFNTCDLGIAVGSAVSAAATHHADNRVMFTFGKAALEVGCLPDEVGIAFGIPLSATGKSPFFDRG